MIGPKILILLEFLIVSKKLILANEKFEKIAWF